MFMPSPPPAGGSGTELSTTVVTATLETGSGGGGGKAQPNSNPFSLMRTMSKMKQRGGSIAVSHDMDAQQSGSLFASSMSQARRKRSQAEGGGNMDVRTLRRRMQQSELQSNTDVQRAAFELKNKITGLMMAVKLEDGDMSGSDNSSRSSDGTPRRRLTSQEQRRRATIAATKRAGGLSKRMFGGDRVQLSLRTKLVDAHKAIPAELEAAKAFRKKLSDDKRHWRQITHRFGVQVYQDSESDDDDEEGDEENDDDEDADDPLRGKTGGKSATVEGDNGTIASFRRRRSSLAHQASVRGQANMLLHRPSKAQSSVRLRGGGSPGRGGGHADSDDEEDEVHMPSLMGHQMTTRVKEAIFGSEEAFQEALAKDKERRRAVARELRERRRSMSMNDLKAAASSGGATLQSPTTSNSTTSLQTPFRNVGAHNSSELWANEDDVAELFTEYISCVRSKNAEWKLRFVSPPNSPQHPNNKSGAMMSSSARFHDSGRTDMAQSASHRGGNETVRDDPDTANNKQLSHNPPVSQVPELPSLAQHHPSPSHPAKPFHGAAPVRAVKLPAINSSAVNKLVLELVEAAGAPNAIVPAKQQLRSSSTDYASGQVHHSYRGTSPFHATERKYRCPHCDLCPAALDNQSLLSKLHAFAASSSGSSNVVLATISPLTSALSPLAVPLNSIEDMRNAQVALGSLNTDRSLYTGIVADGSHWAAVEAVLAQLGPDVTSTALKELDRVMWREVAGQTLKHVDGGDNSGSFLHLSTALATNNATSSVAPVSVDAGTDAQHRSIEKMRRTMKNHITTDSGWTRQAEVVQLSRDKELRTLRRAHEEEKRKYNENLSLLRSIQLDCDTTETDLANLKHRGDVATMVRAQHELMAVEKDIEDVTVTLCDLEFQRREIKKNLAKSVWTADALKHSASKLVDLRSQVNSTLQELKAHVSASMERKLREQDVGKPIEDAEAARKIYGRLGIAEAGRLANESPKKNGGGGGASRLRQFVTAKIQSKSDSGLNASTLVDAVKNAQQVDFVTDDVLADVDEILQSAATMTSPTKGGGVKTSSPNLASLTSGAASPNNFSGSVQSRLPELEFSLRRLLGTICPHCDHYLGGSMYCPQTGALHASQDQSKRTVLETPVIAVEASASYVGTLYRIRCCNSEAVIATNTTPTSPPHAPAAPPPPHPPQSTAASSAMHRAASKRDFFESASTGGVVKTTSGRKKSTVAVTAPTYVEKKRAKAEVAATRRRSSMLLAREGNSKWTETVQANSSDSDSEVEYADADHDSEDEAVEQRRKSVTAEFVRGRHSSADAPVPDGALRAAARRRSMVLNNNNNGSDTFGAVTTQILDGAIASSSQNGAGLSPRQSVARRQTLASFKFGDVVAVESSMPIFGEDSSAIVPGSPTGSGDVVDDEDGDADDPVTMIVMRRRQSAVKDRIAKRKKFKEAAFRAKIKLATAASAFQDAANMNARDTGDADGSDASVKRMTDMATVNLLTVLMQELKWRMTAPTTEPLPAAHTVVLNHVGGGGGGGGHPQNSAMFSPAAQAGLPSPPPSSATTGSGRSSPPPPQLFTPTASLEVTEGAPLIRKLVRSTNTAKLYDGLKPPTTALSAAPGTAAVALATSAAVNAPGGAAAAFYPLWYPNGTDRRQALQKVEADWMQRLAPLLSKISDTVMARSGKLHAVATTPSRRTAAMPPSKLTPSSLSQSGMSPLDPPPPASTKKRGGGGDAFSPPKPAGVSKKKTVDKPVVIPSSSLVIPPAPPTSQRAKALQSAIPALLNPSDLQSAFNNSSSLLQLPKVNPASSVRPGGGGAGGLASHVSAGTLSEGQLTLHIDRLQRVIAIAYQPLRPTIQKLISLERQADELARQLRVAQAQEKRTREAEGDGAPSPAPAMLKVAV